MSSVTLVNNTLEIRQCILINNNCYKQGRTIVPKGIVVHSTGANNPSLKRYVQPDDGVLGTNSNNNDWNRTGISKCVHAFIGKDKDGKVRVYQTLPWNYRCWGCGSGSKGSYNNSYIQFEICEDALVDVNYFNEAFKLAIELCAFLTKQFNFSIENIVSHSEANKLGYASNHIDCDHWLRKFGKSMDWFRGEVYSKSDAACPYPTTSTLYKVRKSWKDAASQIGAYSSLERAKSVCKSGYYVFDSNGNIVYPVVNATTSTYTTKNFIKDIQNAIGVASDGIVGNKTLAALVTVSKTENSRHAVVKPLQKYLNSIGYNTGTPDSIFGNKSYTAVASYQKANGLTVDGIVGINTWKKLFNLT